VNALWDADIMVQSNKQFCKTQGNEIASLENGVQKVCEVFSHGDPGMVSEAQKHLENGFPTEMSGVSDKDHSWSWENMSHKEKKMAVFYSKMQNLFFFARTSKHTSETPLQNQLNL